MGDPKKLRKKYATPRHPWNKTEIESDKLLREEFGLLRKKEILIAETFLKKYKNISKRLIASTNAQAEKEKEQVLGKLQGLGLLPVGAELDQILSLKVNDVLNRRLQSVLFRKGFARTVKQARQFIVHRHVVVGDKEITAPSYLLTLEEESKLSFKPTSQLADEEHPERVNEAAKIRAEAEAVKPKKKGEDTEEGNEVKVEAAEQSSEPASSSAPPTEPVAEKVEDKEAPVEKAEEKVAESPAEPEEKKEESADKEEVTEEKKE